MLDIHVPGKHQNRIKVIFNADDFGYTKGVNRAIIDSHAKGITSSATLMANAGAFDDAVSLAKANPHLGVGVHLNVVEFRPIIQGLQYIVKNTGELYSYTALSKALTDNAKMVSEELEMEFDAQIQRCLSTGLNITHLDSHQHFANKQEVVDILIRIAKKYNLPIRSFKKRNNIVTVDHCISGTALEQVDYIIWTIESHRVQGDQAIEIYWHPGHIDAEYMEVGSPSDNFKKQRKRDTENACSQKLLDYVRDNNIELVNYGNLAETEKVSSRKMPDNNQTPVHAGKAGGRINTYARRFEAAKYLAIGVIEETKFLLIDLPLKIAVAPGLRSDPGHHTQGVLCLPITPDEFFADFPIHPQASLYSEPDGRLAFDIIHISGMNTFEQSLLVFENSRKFCHQNTLWILDDTVPSDVFSAIPDQKLALESRKYAGGSGDAWHGDVFKTLLTIHDFSPEFSYCTVIDEGKPQTVLWQSQPHPERKPRFASRQDIAAQGYSAVLQHADLFLPVNDDIASLLIGKSLAPALHARSDTLEKILYSRLVSAEEAKLRKKMSALELQIKKQEMEETEPDKMALVAELARRRFAWLGENPLQIIEISAQPDSAYRRLFQNTRPCVYKTMNVRFRDGDPRSFMHDADILTAQAYAWSEIGDESYDVILCGQVFHHLEFYWATLLEMRRILKKGGLLCITAPANWQEHRMPFDCQRFYADGMMAMMKFAGLSTIYAYAEHEHLVGRTHCDAIVVVEKPALSALPESSYREAHAAILKLLPDKTVFEVSRGKPTFQSSISRKWQTEESDVKPGNAVSGLFTSKYSFHTNREPNPWWMVDLGRVYELDTIKIFNREDSDSERAWRMDVLLSSDSCAWRKLYSNNEAFGGILDSQPLVVKANAAAARYVRLQLRETVSFHLDQVQVFGYL